MPIKKGKRNSSCNCVDTKCITKKYKVYFEDSRIEFPTVAQIGNTKYEPRSGNKWKTASRPWASKSGNRIIVKANCEMEAVKKAMKKRQQSF